MEIKINYDIPSLYGTDDFSLERLKEIRRFHYRSSEEAFRLMQWEKGNRHYSYYQDASNRLKEARKRT
jgi:hypothetical protein